MKQHNESTAALIQKERESGNPLINDMYNFQVSLSDLSKIFLKHPDGKMYNIVFSMNFYKFVSEGLIMVNNVSQEYKNSKVPKEILIKDFNFLVVSIQSTLFLFGRDYWVQSYISKKLK